MFKLSRNFYPYWLSQIEFFQEIWKIQNIQGIYNLRQRHSQDSHKHPRWRVLYNVQKQPPRCVLNKRCSGNMQQIYRRTPMPKCDFNKVALQLYWNHISALVFSRTFAAYFQNTFYQEHLWVAASECFWNLCVEALEELAKEVQRIIFLTFQKSQSIIISGVFL